MPDKVHMPLKSKPDDVCIGLRLVLNRSGESGSWVRRYKDKTGKMKQYIFASYPETTPAEARAYVDSVRGQDSPIIKSCGEPTVAHLIDVYLNEYVKSQRKQQSYRNVKSALFRNLKPIAKLTLDQVNAAILHELVLTVKKRAPTIAHTLRSELKQAWAYGLSIGLTETPCPVTSMTGGRFKTSSRDRILSDSEIRALFGSLSKYSPALADAIVICLYTGLRSGEVVSIRRDWIEYTDDVLWLTIPHHIMKNGLAHRVPLIGRAHDIIKGRCLDNSGFLFKQQRINKRTLYETHVKQAALSREVYRVDGDVPAWRLHDLRRTTRTTLQRLGCPFEVSESILAHKLPGVSSVYARFQYESEKLHWLSELAKYYEKVTT